MSFGQRVEALAGTHLRTLAGRGTVTPMTTTPQPVLPLNVEAELTIRHIRNITSGLRATGDTFVQSQARALDDLADALERSLHT